MSRRVDPDPDHGRETGPAPDFSPGLPPEAIVEAEPEDTRLTTVSAGGQGYLALVWRRFRRSIPGMLGLILVSTLLIVSVFASFFAPVNPRGAHVAFAPPDRISWHTADGWRLLPVAYAITESDELDPVTYQPLMGPDLDNPRDLRLFARGWSYRLFGVIPTSRHFLGTADGTPLHLLGTDKLGRDILSRGIIGSRISLAIALSSVALITIIGTLLGITSGYIGGRFDLWFQRFVEIILAFPQLPLYLTLATLIPVTAPSSLFLTFVVLVIVALGWAQLSREVRGKTGAPQL